MINAYFFYKVSNYLYKYRVPILPKIIKLIIFLIYNCNIPFEAKIGSNSRFAYGGIGVVIHKRTVLGDNCIIGTNVTIGGKSGHYEIPIIGNNVYIATGAKVLGPIIVGDNVIIGANAVVIDNIPNNCTVAGIPAKIIRNHDIPR
jgi:serine O-acetyltransferase